MVPWFRDRDITISQRLTGLIPRLHHRGRFAILRLSFSKVLLGMSTTVATEATTTKATLLRIMDSHLLAKACLALHPRLAFPRLAAKNTASSIPRTALPIPMATHLSSMTAVAPLVLPVSYARQCCPSLSRTAKYARTAARPGQSMESLDSAINACIKSAGDVARHSDAL